MALRFYLWFGKVLLDIIRQAADIAQLLCHAVTCYAPCNITLGACADIHTDKKLFKGENSTFLYEYAESECWNIPDVRWEQMF